MTRAGKGGSNGVDSSATSERASVRRRKQVVPKRDQDASTFSDILERLVASTPGAEGAALVDREGETVDYAGNIATFDLKIAAAHWQIALGEIAEATRIGAIRQITVHARSRAYLVRQLEESYAVVIILHRHAAFAVSERALQQAVNLLAREAGFDEKHTDTRWFSADVETDRPDRKRPARIRMASTWHPIEVMGAVVGLSPREKGFRIRLPSGAEMTLVRERLGRWFTDEPLDR